MDASGSQTQDYLETRISVRPAVEMLLATTDQQRRDLPDSVPGADPYFREDMQWNLGFDAAPMPIVVPGEKMLVRAMFRNTTDRLQKVKASVVWKETLTGRSPTPVKDFEFTLAPFEQRTEHIPCGFRQADMVFQPLPDNSAAPLREKPAAGNLLTGQPVPVAATACSSCVMGSSFTNTTARLTRWTNRISFGLAARVMPEWHVDFCK